MIGGVRRLLPVAYRRRLVAYKTALVADLSGVVQVGHGVLSDFLCRLIDVFGCF